jgi:chromosome segregation ATPase
LFEKLFKSLDKFEKKNFKPFLKILAHSLQFLDKLQTVDEKLEALKKEIDHEKRDKEVEKTKLMERQIIKLQNNCKDFIMAEETLKSQLEYMRGKNTDLEEELAASKKNYTHLKTQLQDKGDVEVIKEERDQLKKRLGELLKEVNDKENTIEEMVLKINELKETEMQYLDACEDKDNLKKVVEEKEKDLELNRISLENFQNALKEQQENYDWNIGELEKEKGDLGGFGDNRDNFDHI